MATPDAADGSRRQDSVIAASAAMLSLSTVTVVLRFHTRHILLGILGADDWMILAALEEWYTFLLYATSLSCCKISILLLYRRFLLIGWSRICTNIVAVIVAACSIWVIITSFIDCIPLEAVWDKGIQGRCLSLNVKMGNSYSHVVTDFIIFFLPIPFVARLTLGRRQKIGLVLVFCVGFVACLMSVIRIATLHSMDLVADGTYELAPLAIWSAVEVNLAIICACLTTLKPLVVRVFPRLLQSAAGYTATSSGTLDYHGERRMGTAGASLPRTHHHSSGSSSRPGGESAVSVKLDNARSDGSMTDEWEMEDLESVQRGVYLATPPKAYARSS
ncbi:hypothetical protein C8A01DRAFT_31439 [Parachaetomium inaequale]|uniref:Rhodopsin domain-containing protein n=1 Tax=Parachaetomium inaequale TaxID=2588326 RepID=A0AAN6PQK3_9PEZI|nr:hypothetical protein C8A01DRAFT_31439 [Parachaetomium inaequale]